MRQGGRQGDRETGRQGDREGDREGGREGGREGRREETHGNPSPLKSPHIDPIVFSIGSNILKKGLLLRHSFSGSAGQTREVLEWRTTMISSRSQRR